MAEVFNINDVGLLKRNQEMNSLIVKYKSVFKTLLNKFLDQLYNATDAEDVAKEDERVLSEKQYQDIKIQEENIEVMRKKILNGAPLEDSEIAEVLLITQHIQSSMTADAENLITASEQLSQIINEFLKF